MRYEIVGPKVTFLSTTEGRVLRSAKGKEGVGKVPEKTEAEKMESGRRRLIEVIGEAGKQGWRPNSGMGDPESSVSGKGKGKEKALATGLNDSDPPSASTSKSTLAPPVASSSATSPLSATSVLDPPEGALMTAAETEAFTRNYLILSECEGISRSEEMTALFGDHHVWGSTKVVPSRSRVISS